MDFPEYTSWLLNDTYNDFWKNQENANAIEKLTVPTLFTDGWYDFYIDGITQDEFADLWEQANRYDNEEATNEMFKYIIYFRKLNSFTKEITNCSYKFFFARCKF